MAANRYFSTNRGAAAEAGRKAMARRWSRPGNEAERTDANLRMNTARLAQYVDLAHESALRMGMVLTPTQATAAGQALLTADLRDRLAVARIVKAERARVRDLPVEA